MRTTVIKSISQIDLFTNQLFWWAQQYREIILLDSNKHNLANSTFDFALAADAITSIKTDYFNAFEDLKQYQQTTKDWIFGYLSYDVKNDVEPLQSNNVDGLCFSDIYFFQPKKLFFVTKNLLTISYLNFCADEIEDDFNEIIHFVTPIDNKKNELIIEQRISKEKYLEKVSQLQQNIQLGKLYEINFCMEFYAKKAIITPEATFLALNKISKAPFAVFLKIHHHYLLCASPERYLRKEGEMILSQPIKGTAKRYEDSDADKISKHTLQNDPKERAENIMITDLVRNDISKIAQKGSVQVTELCKIYSFLQVHQMISTITAKIDAKYTAMDALKNTFPMGSMTGAPKIAAMQLIENYETTKRGLYSGAVGYFCPKGDFDFNVVIRSILYNQATNYVSFSVGSAITAISVPENEYEECLLKAKAMLDVLN